MTRKIASHTATLVVGMGLGLGAVAVASPGATTRAASDPQVISQLRTLNTTVSKVSRTLDTGSVGYKLEKIQNSTRESCSNTAKLAGVAPYDC